MTQSKTYVVDQGWMREKALAALIANQPLSKFVIPDVAFVEMSKSGNWEETMRPSLYNFCPAATRTFLSLSVGEALAIELERGKSIEHDLLPDSFRDFVPMRCHKQDRLAPDTRPVRSGMIFRPDPCPKPAQ